MNSGFKAKNTNNCHNEVNYQKLLVKVSDQTLDTTCPTQELNEEILEWAVLKVNKIILFFEKRFGRYLEVGFGARAVVKR